MALQLKYGIFKIYVKPVQINQQKKLSDLSLTCRVNKFPTCVFRSQKKCEKIDEWHWYLYYFVSLKIMQIAQWVIFQIIQLICLTAIIWYKKTRNGNLSAIFTAFAWMFKGSCTKMSMISYQCPISQ